MDRKGSSCCSCFFASALDRVGDIVLVVTAAVDKLFLDACKKRRADAAVVGRCFSGANIGCVGLSSGRKIPLLVRAFLWRVADRKAQVLKQTYRGRTCRDVDVSGFERERKPRQER